MANATAYGFLDLEDLFSQRVADTRVEVIQTAIVKSLEEYNRQLNGMMSLVKPEVDWKYLYQLAASGTLQPLDENGNPIPIQPLGTYPVGFPIQGAGTAWGNNRVSRANMTIQDVNRMVVDAMTKDSDWMIRHLLAAWYTNVAWTYTDPIYGAIAVQPLAITSDGVVYTNRSGAATTAQHFLGQAAAIADATNPYPTIYDTLFSRLSNSGRVIALIPTNLKATTMALLEFREATTITAAQGLIQASTATQFTGNQMDNPGMGDRLLGVTDSGVWVYEWSRLPNDYILAYSEGADPIFGMRQYPQPELQGFFPEFNTADGNHYEYRSLRYAGFGALNRVGALVFRISNATYAVPTGYLAPLAS